MYKNKNLFFLLSLLIGSLLSGCQNKEERQQTLPNSYKDPAIAKISQQIAEKPDQADLYFARAELFYVNEGYDEAIQDLNKALSIDSANVDYLHLLADVYLDYFQSRQALQTMKKAAELHADNIPTLLKLAEFQLILQQHQKSLRTVDRILQMSPQNAEGYFMMGLNFKEMGDTARAVNSFQQSVELDPEIIDAWVFLGQLQAGLGNELAIRYFNSALSIEPDNIEVLHAKADYYSDQAELEKAVEVYRQMVKLDPQYEQSYFNMGLLFLDQDSIQKAYEQFNLLVGVSPLHIRGYYYRGLSSEFLGNFEGARQDYEQALRLSPDYQNALDGLERVNQVIEQPQ
jgi:tetratricopeptide (TPR) repeat protein